MANTTKGWKTMESKDTPTALIAKTTVGQCEVRVNVRQNNGDMFLNIKTARGKRLRIVINGYSSNVAAITNADTAKEARQALVTMGLLAG